MEYRLLGASGLRVPVLSLGTGTFGGTNEFFKRWGQTDVAEASRLIDVSLDHGLSFFDTANVYSLGAAEEILGAALKGRRQQALIATKGTFAMGDGANDRGASRYHLQRECEASLKRLATDVIDVYFIHGFDSHTPVEETLRALDDLVHAGKVRYIGCSNFAAWQLMKALSVSERHSLNRYVIYQGYYSLVGRDYENELMPLALDQGVGLMVWSALGWGRLTGRIKRGQPLPAGRLQSGGAIGGPEVNDTLLYDVLSVLEALADETGRTVPQIAINWLLQKPTVCNVVIGARNEQQLLDNLAASDWKLTDEQVARLDQVSAQKVPYPHWVGAR